MSEKHEVDPARAGSRLDHFLTALRSVGSRRRAREALESGKVRVDGRDVGLRDAARELAGGSTVEIAWNRPGTSRGATRGRRTLEQHGLRIVHEDADLVVVEKPPGMLTDAATRRQRREPSVRSLLHEWLRGQGDEAFIVHRIDRDTSGLVVVARNARAAERLSRQFREHSPRRLYWVLVQGGPARDAGEWVHAMRWDPEHNRQRPAREGERGAAVARARYRVLERIGDRASVLEVELQTGRRNQIRLHCQLEGCPLVGERQYVEQPRRDALRPPRQALHARRLSFRHPTTGEQVGFSSELPGDLQRLLAGMRRENPGGAAR